MNYADFKAKVLAYPQVSSIISERVIDENIGEGITKYAFKLFIKNGDLGGIMDLHFYRLKDDTCFFDGVNQLEPKTDAPAA